MHPARLRYLRRWYFTGIISALLILVLTRFFVVRTPPQGAPVSTTQVVTTQVLDSLIAATVAGGFIAALLVWLFPSEDRTPEMELVQLREIEATIQTECSVAREWIIRARTASYFRSRTLPWLANSAMTRNSSILVRVQVMDPTDDNLLNAYMRYLNTHEGVARKWTIDRVRNEIYATVLSVYAWRESCPRLELEIGLSSEFWILSMDMSQRMVLITGQYKGHPGLVHREGTAFYNSYRDEFEAGMMSCRMMDPSIRSPKPEELDIDAIQLMLDKLGLDRSKLSAENYEKIDQHIRRPEHRYE